MRQLLTYIILIGAFFYGCNGSPGAEMDSTTYKCTAENKVQNEEGSWVFRSDNIDFKGAENQSQDFAFNGDYSIKLDSTHKYGMSFILTDIKKDEFFQASVWQKETDEPGALICSVTGNATFAINSLENGFYEYSNGWMKHSIQFTAITDLDSLTFFIFAGSNKKAAYYDDLAVIRHKNRPNQMVENGQVMSIYLPDSSQMIIDTFVNKAVQKEIIADKYKEYVSGYLTVEEDSIPIDLRLKGDWTDHLISGNPSYRIKTKSGTAYNGLRSFSIQHPKTRNYMHEWFMHKLCDDQDLLSTYYSFLQVKQGGKNQGVYAIEEHFDKQLLESRNRREGPILKMDETGFWALAVYANKHGLNRIAAPYYESAIPAAFKDKRTRKSPVLFKQFNNGALLLNLFKYGYDRPDLLFDVKQVATYFALMDLGNIHHSLAWHNRRFYYNPVTAKLEHVGFDMIPMIRPFNPLLATQQFRVDLSALPPESCLNYYFFLNPEFRSAYTSTLVEISSVDYLDSVFTALGDDITNFETLIDAELPAYKFDTAAYYEKAAMIREELTTLDKRWDKFMANPANWEAKAGSQKGKYDLGTMPFYLPEISINAYRSEIDSTSFMVEFENFHFDSVTVLGYSIQPNKKEMIPLKEPIGLAGFIGGAAQDTASVILQQKPSRFFFELENIPGEIKKKKYIKREKPKGEHPRIKLYESFKENSAYYTINEDVVTVNSGNYTIDELVYIPAPYQVIFEPGTKIDLVNKGGIILNGTTKILGTITDSIQFTSSDGTGMGITILQAESVDVAYVSVSNMNTLDYEGWGLTGAFTIYESHVTIDGLTVVGNNCEDGLNIIRSSFEIQNCLFEKTKSDGFDADFCTGTFMRSIFRNTGNDCIDFSGSVVEISDIEILNSGDKGVSAGERSTLYLTNISVIGAITGLASKDDSRIEGENITVQNAEVGLALFQKKPEYSGSTMVLNQCNYKNLNEVALIEKGSELTVGEKSYGGYQKFDIDKMYARFEKK